MKKLLTIFLSLLSLTTFGQVHSSHTIGTPLSATNGATVQNGVVGTDSSKIPLNISVAQLRASTTLQTARTYHITDLGRQGDFLFSIISQADNGGTALHDGNGFTYLRQFQGAVYASWFGVVADGATNCTAQVQAFLNVLNGHEGIFQFGVILSDSVSIPKWTAVDLHGAGEDSTTLLTTNGDQLFNVVGDQTNVKMHDMKLSSTYTLASTDFGHGLYYSIGVHSKRLEFYNINWNMPNAGATALNILVQVSGHGGSWDGINIHDNTFVNIGQSAISLLNRDTAGIASLVASVASGSPSTVIRTTGLDSGKNFRIVHNQIGNLGIAPSAVFGLGLTLDGNGYGGIVSDNTIFNCLNIGLENTGYWYVDWRNNKFEKVISGRLWQYWAFGSVVNAPIYFNTLSYNKELEFSTGNVDAFQGMNYSTFDHNTIYTSGGVKLTNCNHNKFNDDYYFGAFNFNVWIRAISGQTSIDNIFTNCTLDQSISSVNTNNIMFDGSLCKYNSFVNCKMLLGSNGGLYTGTRDTCSNLNSVSDPIINGSSVFNAIRSVTVPSTGARDTLKFDDDLINYHLYRLKSNTAIGSVWLQSNIHRDFYVQDSSAFADTVFTTAGGASVVVPPFSTVHISGDSTNFLSTGSTGLYQIGNYILSDTTKPNDSLCIGCNQTNLLPTAVSEVFYTQSKVGGTSSPVGFAVRMKQNAHDTANFTGISINAFSAGADSINSVTGSVFQLTSTGAYTGSVVGYQTLGGSLAGLHSYTHFLAGAANTLASGATQIGFQLAVPKAANWYSVYSLGTASAYLLGNLDLGTHLATDSTDKLGVGGQAVFDSTVTIGTGLKVTGTDTVNGTSYTSGAATFGGAIKNTGTDTVVGNLVTKSISADSLYLANVPSTPAAFAHIFYTQSTVAGTSNPIGLFVQMKQNAHDTTNFTGVQVNAFSAGADSISSVVGSNFQMTSTGAYTGSAVGYQTLGGSLAGLGKYVHFNVGAANTLAPGATQIGFQVGVSKAANWYSIYSLGTASAFLLGNLDLGTHLASDSSNKLGVGGNAIIDSALTVKGSVTLDYTTQSGNYTVLLTDYTLFLTGSSGTITLPSPVTYPGRVLVLKHTFSGTITLSGTLGSGTPSTLAAAGTTGAGLTLQSDGIQWWATGYSQ